MILIGYSGHAFVVHGIFEAMGEKVSAYYDTEEKKNNPFTLQYLGNDAAVNSFDVLKKRRFFISIGDNDIRRKLFEKYAEAGCFPVNAIHPSALIDPSVEISKQGVMIGARVIINAMARIGKAVICNSGCIIEHECDVEDFVHVAPGAVLCGNVQVGTGTFIGANSVIRQGIKIGSNCVIGAGATVVKDVPNDTIIIGSRSKELNEKPAEPEFVAANPTTSTDVSNLKVLFIGKADDPYSKYAGEFVSLHFPNSVLIFGKRGEQFPREALEWRGDLMVSYLSQWIIPEAVLKNASMAAINFHPGPPEYPGTGCTNFAVYHGVHEYGVTCHHMLSKVDTGKIISVKRFPVYPADTVYSITQRCYSQILQQCYEVFDQIIQGNPLPESDEHWTRRPYLRKELNNLCKITPDMSQEEMNRRIKATNFVRHWAFMQVGDNIFKLVDEKK